MSQAAVEFRDVVKSFRGQRALDSISLEVGEGEVYGLLGPNGSGKTTLIRCIIGMLTPDSGTVTVLGQRMPNMGVLSRIGYMTQAAALYPDLTVQENVEFFASINDAEASVDEAIDFTELSDRRRSVVSTLSGGMRTRASLACAIVHRPELLLLDEPTVGVDPRLRIQLWEGFQAMADHGATIVVSSHVMDEAERCQRLGLLLAGKLLAEGTVGELKAKAGVNKLEDAFLALSEEPAR